MKIDCIILCTCSNGQYKITKECLDSIKSNKYNFKIYLLNHGKKDKQIRRLGRGVNYYKEFEFGTPITIEMNHGIEKALKETDLVMNINNDVIFHPSTLDTMISIMREKDILSLCGHIITEKEDLKNYDIREDYNLYYKNVFISENKYKSWLQILFEDFGFDLYSLNIWHKEYFERVGLFDSVNFNKGIYFFDTDFQYRGALMGIDTYVASSALYYHACSYTAKTNQKTRERLDEMYVEMKLKYRDKWLGDLGNSKYIGTQHNEESIVPYPKQKTSKQILEYTCEMNKTNKKFNK